MSERALERVDTAWVNHVASIMGQGSAAQKALDECARRQQQGEDCAIFLSGRYFVVGPARPATTERE